MTKPTADQIEQFTSYYAENGFGFAGALDCAETLFPGHPAAFQQALAAEVA